MRDSTRQALIHVLRPVIRDAKRQVEENWYDPWEKVAYLFLDYLRGGGNAPSSWFAAVRQAVDELERKLQEEERKPE